MQNTLNYVSKNIVYDILIGYDALTGNKNWLHISPVKFVNTYKDAEKINKIMKAAITITELDKAY